jgi:hypothetical protein
MKRLSAKVGEYQKDGQTKGEYVKIGVIMSGDNGEYMLIDPSVNLAGVLVKQNVLADKQGKPQRDSVMASVFDDSQQNNNQGFQQPMQQPQKPMQGGYQQQAPRQGCGQPMPQGGYNPQGQ